MNYFADDKKTAIIENFPRRIGQIDGAFDSVTKAELLSQANRGLTNRHDPARASNLVHDVAPIMRFDLLLHGRHDIGRTQVDLFSGRCAAGDKIRAHEIAAQAPRRPIAAILRSAW